MTVVQLHMGPYQVARYEGGFADPLPLFLFGADDGVDGQLTTTCHEARVRLASLDVDAATIAIVHRALRASEATSPGLLRAPEHGWAPLAPSALFSASMRRHALGFRPEFDHLSPAHIAKVIGCDVPAVERVLLLCSWSATLADLDDDAPVRYDISAAAEPGTYEETAGELRVALPRDEDQRQACASFAAALSCHAIQAAPGFAEASASALAQAGERIPASSQKEACALGEKAARARATTRGLTGAVGAARSFERWPTLADAVVLLTQGLSERRCVAVEDVIGRLLTADSELGPHDPSWGELQAWVKEAYESGATGPATTALTALATRAPREALAHASHDVPALAGNPDLVERWLAAIRVPREPAWVCDRESWRSHAAELAGHFIDLELIESGLALLVAASHVDHPPGSLVSALRHMLGRLYGLEMSISLDLARAPFLLDVNRAAHEQDDVRDLSRILCDGVLGAILEHTVDENASEAFFEVRIAPALAYLNADPTETGRRVSVARARGDAQTPGLWAVLLFLLLLAGLIVGVGLALLAL